MADLMKKLVLLWKRGIVIYIVGLAVTYLIGVVSGIGAEIMTTLGRAMTIGGITAIAVSWVINPIISGWVATKVVEKVK